EIRSLVAARDLAALGALWQSGVAVDWSLLLDNDPAYPPQRIAAPTYPFARQRYWLTEAESFENHSSSGRNARTTTAPAKRASEGAKAGLLVPVWRRIAPAGQQAPRADQGILVIGGDQTQCDTLRSHYDRVWSMQIDPKASIGTLRRQLQDIGRFDQMIWIAPQRAMAATGAAEL